MANLPPLSLYIHIPWCVQKCPYCDFNSHALKGEVPHDDYVQHLLNDLQADAQYAQGREIGTIFIGGGTPSLLSGPAMQTLLDGVRACLPLAAGAEITMEANPGTVEADRFVDYQRAGVNRISFGVQSARDSQLKTLGRPHTARQARAAFAAARRAGFTNISGDIMLALPHYTQAEFDETLELIAEGGATHISAYLLKIEPGSAFGRHPPEGLPSPDEAADFYLYAVEQLEHHGYRQYEISNFARPGHASRHNLKYWTLGEYAGFGPGAYSDFGGVRYGYIRDLDRYIAGELVLAESEHIPASEREMEYIMLRLRTTEGMNIREFENRFRRRFDPLGARLEVYADHGLAQRTEQGWRLTPRGFLVSNQIIGELQELLNREKLERLRRAQEGDYRVV